jgi:hypothetical protein
MDFLSIEKIIIYFNCPSFGDYLMWQNLPELFFKKYNLYTYISNQCCVHNTQTYDLLINTNPYIKGFTDEEPNVVINCREPEKYKFQSTIYQESFGFFGHNEIPKIYYTPKKIEKYKNSILYDLSARTNSIDLDLIKKTANELVNNLKSVNDLDVYCLNYTDVDNSIKKIIPDIEFQYIDVENLFDVCNILNSVTHYIGINSGSSLMASSIKEYYNNDLMVHFFTLSPHTLNGQNWDPNNVNLIYYTR